MDEHGDQQTAGIGEDVALAALDLLARVLARISQTTGCIGVRNPG
jgi:hypothetical protein